MSVFASLLYCGSVPSLHACKDGGGRVLQLRGAETVVPLRVQLQPQPLHKTGIFTSGQFGPSWKHVVSTKRRRGPRSTHSSNSTDQLSRVLRLPAPALRSLNTNERPHAVCVMCCIIQLYWLLSWTQRCLHSLLDDPIKFYILLKKQAECFLYIQLTSSLLFSCWICSKVSEFSVFTGRFIVEEGSLSVSQVTHTS